LIRNGDDNGINDEVQCGWEDVWRGVSVATESVDIISVINDNGDGNND